MIVTATSKPAPYLATGKTASAERQTAAAAPASVADKVSISAAGRQAAQADAAGVERYAIPGWLADFGFIVESEIATRQPDGTLAGGTRGDWFARKYPEAATATEHQRTTYSALIDGHYRSLLEANGIGDTAGHYQALIADKTSSENLHRQMVDRIKADPVLMALLPKMGKAHLVV